MIDTIHLAISGGAQTTLDPWWGVPLLAGAFTLLGAGVSQAATWLLDRSRARREDMTRWHRDRLHAYSEVLLKLDQVHTQLTEDETSLEPESVFDAVEPQVTRATLLAGPRVDTAIHEALTGLVYVADGGWNSDNSPGVEEMYRRFQKLRSVIKEELGIPRTSP